MGEQKRQKENGSQQVQSISRRRPVPNMSGIFAIEDRSAPQHVNQAALRMGPLRSAPLDSPTKHYLIERFGIGTLVVASQVILYYFLRP
jgi:hypothetical protein